MGGKATYCYCRNNYFINGCDGAPQGRVTNCDESREDLWGQGIGDIGGRSED